MVLRTESRRSRLLSIGHNRLQEFCSRRNFTALTATTLTHRAAGPESKSRRCARGTAFRFNSHVGLAAAAPCNSPKERRNAPPRRLNAIAASVLRGEAERKLKRLHLGAVAAGAGGTVQMRTPNQPSLGGVGEVRDLQQS